MLRLAVFLGNPGPEYERNRHNAGRLLAERLPFYAALSWTKKFKGRYASCDFNVVKEKVPHLAIPPSPRGEGSPLDTPPSPKGEGSPLDKCYFIMPETYMNSSGESVQAAAAFFKIKPEEIIVVHDELELAPGFVSFKYDGGLSGHNGLRSIKCRLGTAGFWRLRVGIGRPAGRLPGEGGPQVKGVHAGGTGEIAGWVLSDFTSGEEPFLDAALNAAAGALTSALVSGPESLLPEWGKKRIAASPPPLLTNNR
jgi:PTH1 family peptidyl-tRNA hydrolase